MEAATINKHVAMIMCVCVCVCVCAANRRGHRRLDSVRCVAAFASAKKRKNTYLKEDALFVSVVPCVCVAFHPRVACARVCVRARARFHTAAHNPYYV